MTLLKKGMVVDVNLDSAIGSETGKIRSCIILTNDVYNGRVPVREAPPLQGGAFSLAVCNTLFDRKYRVCHIQEVFPFCQRSIKVIFTL
jgi:mRNA-degrading endonuclease toxin of MazEF toxin-antitoxin module